LVLVSPVAQLRPVVAANQRRYGVTYEWAAESEAVAAEDSDGLEDGLPAPAEETAEEPAS